MSTFSRLIRFDQDKLATIYSSGSVDYTVGDFNLSSINTESDDPNKALISFPIKTNVYSTERLAELYTLEFEEFVDVVEIDTDVVELSADQALEIEILRSQLSNAETELIDKSDVETLNQVSKELIIKLRRELGQDSNSEGFADVFPYLPIILPEDE